jgi:4'-phosphopantetheinyl transferase EntD
MSTKAREHELAIGRLYQNRVSVCIADSAMYGAPIFLEEFQAIRSACLKRQREFRAGRAAARQSLKLIGAPSISIPPAADRTPIWPSGYIGSISHCESLCGAIAASSSDLFGIGLDLESAQVLTEDIIPLVLDVSEEECIIREAKLGRGLSAALAFSAKEAFYKAVYPVERRLMDFLDVTLTVFRAGECYGGFLVSSASRHWDGAGRWEIIGGVIHTGYTLERYHNDGVS